MKIKVCGMKNPINIAEISRCHPDYLGFIFYKESKRYVGDQFSPDFLLTVPPEVRRVGVFVDQPINYIVDVTNLLSLDLVQLHGSETPQFCQELLTKVAFIELIKAFSVGHDFDPLTLSDYTECSHYFLFDTKSDEKGGSGKQFDWNILKSWQLEKPIFLAGGISKDDAPRLRELEESGVNIHAVDINSCFESEPGIKSLDLVQQFITEIRS